MAVRHHRCGGQRQCMVVFATELSGDGLYRLEFCVSWRWQLEVGEHLGWE